MSKLIENDDCWFDPDRYIAAWEGRDADAGYSKTIRVSLFSDERGYEVEARDISLADLQSIILTTSASAKDKLPLLKLVGFGNARTENNSLRHNANVIAISGIELDYDSKAMSLDAAVATIVATGLMALIYTSPSYTVDKPKWRVLCPTSCELPPEERKKLVARVNGVFGGVFAGESFTLSQAYYYGKVGDNPAHRCVIVEGDFIDLRHDLDAGALGKAARTGDDGEHKPGAEPEAPIAIVACALAAIPNPDLEWYDRNTIGMATWRATGGSAEGHAEYDKWCQKSQLKYDAKKVAGRWSHWHGSPPTELGFGTLAFKAFEADPHWRDAYDARIEAAMAEANRNAVMPEFLNASAKDEEPRASEGQQSSEEPKAKKESASTQDAIVTKLSDWLTRHLDPPDFICGDWLTTTSRTILAADTGMGKTLWAIALGMSSAAGLTFLHWRATRPIRVLYIDGEMARRVMKDRLHDAVARLGKDIPPPDNFHMLNHEDVPDGAWRPLNTRDGQLFIEKQILRIGGIDLIMFDNVMSLIAGDQKDEEGWQKVMPWVRYLTRRRIAQIWLHHTGHDVTRGYGTKTREWQMDNVLHLDRVERRDTDVSFCLKFTKARERMPETRNDFRDIKIALVNNQWRWESASGVGQKTIAPKAQKFYEALCRATATSERQANGCPAATIDEWKAQCEQMGLVSNDKPDSARSLLSKYRLELVTANWIACNDTLSWTLADNPEAIF